MEYLGESIALGVDALVFGICYNLYHYKKSAVKSIENVQVVDVDRNLMQQVSKEPGKKLDYVVIRGKVKALCPPLSSPNSRNTYGVIQKFTIKEHVITRSSVGFWCEHERTVQEVINSVPFALRSGRVDIEVADALSASYLDLETISDSYEPSSPSFMDHIWGYYSRWKSIFVKEPEMTRLDKIKSEMRRFFTGVRYRGLQHTEEMVREGALLTGIGQLALSEDKRSLRLQPPKDGLPFFITSLPLSTLSKRLENEKQTYKYLAIITGVIGAALIGVMARRWWLKKVALKLEEERRRQLEATRRERRQRVRPQGEDLPDSQLCAVCRLNPKEIILLPCGHVCICEDCSDDITDLCPVCRTAIESRSAAYFA